jgi:hypothetical protein
MKKRQTEEEDHQQWCAECLDRLNVLWTHVANERQCNIAYRKKLARLGVKSGVPDILIFTPPPIGWYVGTAIELKRPRGPKGGSRGKASPNQLAWLAGLKECRWYTAVCHGWPEVKELLEGLGYGG